MEQELLCYGSLCAETRSNGVLIEYSHRCKTVSIVAMSVRTEPGIEVEKQDQNMMDMAFLSQACLNEDMLVLKW